MHANSAKKKGFTFVEIMLVIVILGILTGLSSFTFLSSLKRGRDAKRKADLEQVKKAVEMYYEDKRQFPDSDQLVWGSSLTDTDSGKVYMQKLPIDPKGTSYTYVSDGTYFQIYACLENPDQILPFTVENTDIECSINCKDRNDQEVSCVWGVSSTNANP